MFDSIEHILSFQLKTLNTMMLALDLPQFSQSEHEFLREYVQVMEPVATAVDNLQSSNAYYAIYLPTLHSIKYAFDDMTTALRCLGALKRDIIGDSVVFSINMMSNA